MANRMQLLFSLMAVLNLLTPGTDGLVCYNCTEVIDRSAGTTSNDGCVEGLIDRMSNMTCPDGVTNCEVLIQKLPKGQLSAVTRGCATDVSSTNSTTNSTTKSPTGTRPDELTQTQFCREDLCNGKSQKELLFSGLVCYNCSAGVVNGTASSFTDDGCVEGSIDRMSNISCPAGFNYCVVKSIYGAISNNKSNLSSVSRGCSTGSFFKSVNGTKTVEATQQLFCQKNLCNWDKIEKELLNSSGSRYYLPLGTMVTCLAVAFFF